jgi:hypothetical protein
MPSPPAGFVREKRAAAPPPGFVRAAPNARDPAVQPQPREFVGPQPYYDSPKDIGTGVLDMAVSGARSLVNKPAATLMGLKGAIDPNDTYMGARDRYREAIATDQLAVKDDRLRTPQGQTMANAIGAYANAAHGLGGSLLRAPEVAGDAVERVAGPEARDFTESAASLLSMRSPRMAMGERAPGALSREAPRVIAMEGGSVGASASAASTAVAQASPTLQAAVSRLQQAGKPISLESLNRYIEADTLPVPVKLTRGEATRDPVVLSEERNMRGANPEAAQFYNERHKALVENLSRLRDEAGPNVHTTNAVEHGESLINSYRQVDAAAEAEIKGLYDQLRAASGSGVPIDAKTIWSNTRNALHKDLSFDHAPQAIMKSLEELANSNRMTFENFESIRTQLARIQRSPTADGNLKHAAGIIRAELEKLPMFPGSGFERMKPMADAARAAARRRFQAMEADPAYEAAVNGTVPPDRFVQKFIVGGTRDQVAAMRKALANDPQAVETMSTAAFDRLRESAGVDALGNGTFRQAGFNKQMTALDPKFADLFPPALAEKLRQLGNVARTIESEVPGSFVNRSNTFVAQAGNAAARSAEGMLNVAALGVPVGTATRALIDRATIQRRFRQSLDPASGLEKKPN